MSATATQVVGVPGLDVATASSPGVQLDVLRMDANDWLVSLVAGTADSGVVVALHGAAALQFEPAQALLQTSSNTGVGAGLLRIELDVCGAWVTFSCADTPQPIVVRRAGWIDLRGPLAQLARVEPTDDRVGLGPGDALVLIGPGFADGRDADHEPFAAECLPAALLRCCTAADAQGMLTELQHAAQRFTGHPAVGPVVVLRVPLDAREESARRVAAVTGLSPGGLSATRYPLGEQLMARPPEHPREARMELPADTAQLRLVRELLRRLLASWRISDEDRSDAIQLLATETASNAIRHGQSPVTLIARYDGHVVRVEVGDASRSIPTPPRQSDSSDEGGRGMFLIDALSQDWGVVSTINGKRVWFEVSVD